MIDACTVIAVVDGKACLSVEIEALILCMHGLVLPTLHIVFRTSMLSNRTVTLWWKLWNLVEHSLCKLRPDL